LDAAAEKRAMMDMGEVAGEEVLTELVEAAVDA
jgi:hypothetical protein